MKKSIILTGFLCLFCIVSAFAWKGDGNSWYPYQIESAKDLKDLADSVNLYGKTYTNTYFKIMNDIDLSAYPNWEPIGNSATNVFKGMLDGNNKIISNLTITGFLNNRALFGFTHWPMELRNIIIQNANVVGGSNIACLVANNDGGDLLRCAVIDSKAESNGYTGLLMANNGNNSVILECYVQGTIIAEGAHAGGICASSGYTTIGECHADVVIDANGIYSVGAILGYASNNNCLITHCYSRGVIKGSKIVSIGGICGAGANYDCPAINDCGAFLTSITGPSGTNIGKIMYSGIKRGCYSWQDMLINKNPLIDSDPNGVHGENITTAQVNTPSFWLITKDFHRNLDSNLIVWDLSCDGFPYLKWLNNRFGGNPTCIAGAGTSASPYIINSRIQLTKLRDEVNAGDSKTGKVYLLDTDIDMADIPNWEPIGVSITQCFNGTFLGNNHTIKNLTIVSSKNNQGLFGITGPNAIIQNVIIDSANIYAGDNQACLVASNQGTVTECAVINSTCSSYGYCGLIVGRNTGNGNISKCYAQGTIISINNVIGGICGINEGPGGISDCFANVILSGKSSSTLGRAGGIVGYQRTTAAPITNCYTRGQINSGSGIGGICAGFSNYTQKITGCISAMLSLDKGARICNEGTMQIDNCYANEFMMVNGSVSVNPIGASSANGRSASLATLKNNKTLWENAGFNFNTIWVKNTNEYPFLKWMGNSTGSLKPVFTESISQYPEKPELEVLGNGSVIVPNSTTVSISNGTDFGKQSYSTTHSFSLYNKGTGNLVIDSVIVSNPVAYELINTGNSTLAPGESGSIDVTYKAITSVSATISVFTNSAPNPYKFTVSGSTQFTQESFSIYPNPARRGETVTLGINVSSAHAGQEYKLTVMQYPYSPRNPDFTGILYAGYNQFTINTTGWSGTFLVLLYTGYNLYTSKLIIQ